ncbi:MAG: MFS transporter [Candidatus Thorarchaeota archaeon]|nr:MAG: MFS transporter [Candidatus Thorarchaeota archaeon]
MLTQGQKIYFGMARLGPSIMLDMLDLANALFYFSIQALPAIFTGIAIAMGYVSTMIATLLFGNLSDRYPTKRWGRRKPFVVLGAPLMAISFLFVFTPHLFVAQGDTIGLFLYALVTISMFRGFYGMTMTPFQSWMPELTEPEERPSVSSWQNVANFLGFVIGVLGTTFLAIEATGWGLPPEILLMILAFIVIQLVGFVGPIAGLHKEGKYIAQPNLRESFSTALKNRDFVGWMAAQGLLSIGFAMIIKSTFPFINDYLRFGLTEFLVFGVELLAVVFTFFLVWRWMIRNKGKRVTLQVAMLVAAVSLPLSFFITTAIEGFIMIALVGSGVAGYYLFPYIVYADFAHKDEIMTGEGKAGLYTSTPTIPLNTCEAISALLWGLIFSLPVIAPVPGSPGDAVTLGYLYWGPVAAFFIFLGILVLFKVNLDPDFESLKAQYAHVEETTDPV